MIDSGGVLVLVDSDDALATALVDHTRRSGRAALLVDLHHDHLSTAIDAGAALVRCGGRAVRPSLVINRSGVSSLGMPSANAAEHRPGGLAPAYAAAREQQGVVLAVLAMLAGSARIVDPVSTTDLWLQPERWRRRLRSSNIACDASAERPPGAQVLLAGGRVCHAVRAGRRIELGSGAVETVELAADVLGLTLGRVDLSFDGDRTVVVGWHPRPLQRAGVSPTVVHDVAEALGVHALPDAPADGDVELFVPDLVSNVERRQASARGARSRPQ